MIMNTIKNTKLIYATIGIAVMLGMTGTSFLNIPTASAGSDESCENRDERLEKLAQRNDLDDGNEQNNDGISKALVNGFDNSACD